MAALYSEVLLDHFRRPRNYGSLPDADVVHEEFNPLCGDRIRIELRLNGDAVAEVRFRGDGCAISIAAASLLTQMVQDSDVEEIEGISPERMIAELQSDIKPTRVQCALLALEALQAGLKEYRK